MKKVNVYFNYFACSFANLLTKGLLRLKFVKKKKKKNLLVTIQYVAHVTIITQPLCTSW